MSRLLETYDKIRVKAGEAVAVEQNQEAIKFREFSQVPYYKTYRLRLTNKLAELDRVTPVDPQQAFGLHFKRQTLRELLDELEKLEAWSRKVLTPTE